MESEDLEKRAKLDAFLAGREGRLYRMAVLATGNRDEALDLVQEAMYKLVRHYAHRPESEWAPLLYRILQTTIRDWYRRQRVRRGVLRWWVRPRAQEREAALEDLPAPDGHGPEQRVADVQLAERLDQALGLLPLRQQQVFLLRAWEGLSVAETARAMGCGEGSVKTHYSRAVHRLRELMNETEDEV